MYALTSNDKFYMYKDPTDMRKSFNGLSGLVLSAMNRDPLSGEVFVFMNKRRDRIKLLRWESDGFLLYYKRLESGTFEIPECQLKSGTLPIKWTTLVLLLEGICMKNIRKRKRFLDVTHHNKTIENTG